MSEKAATELAIKDYLTVQQVAEKLDCSVYTVYYWMRIGKDGIVLQHVRLGSIRVHPDWLEEFVAAFTHKSEPQAVAPAAEPVKRKRKNGIPAWRQKLIDGGVLES